MHTDFYFFMVLKKEGSSLPSFFKITDSGMKTPKDEFRGFHGKQ